MTGQKFIKTVGYTGDASPVEDASSDASTEAQPKKNYAVTNEPNFAVGQAYFVDEDTSEVDEETLKKISKSNYEAVLTPVF